MTEHPMQPPPQLLIRHRGFATTWEDDMRAAYAAGADAQLEACEKWVGLTMPDRFVESLRAAMRPNPPSLKQQALEALERMHDTCLMTWDNETIRRALEALPDD
jgi:hypothetical protein